MSGKFSLNIPGEWWDGDCLYCWPLAEPYWASVYIDEDDKVGSVAILKGMDRNRKSESIYMVFPRHESHGGNWAIIMAGVHDYMNFFNGGNDAQD